MASLSELNNVGIPAPSFRDLSLLLRRDKLWGVRLKFMYGSLAPLPQSFIVVDIFQRQDLPWNMASRILGHQLFEVLQIQVWDTKKWKFEMLKIDKKNSIGTSPILRSLCIRIHDIIHPNDPVDNGKGSGNKRADKVRHHCRSAKSSFGLLGFCLRFPGIWSFLLPIHELNMFSPICSAWNASKFFFHQYLS